LPSFSSQEKQAVSYSTWIFHVNALSKPDRSPCIMPVAGARDS
jgi:hypothetical protein